MTNTPIRPDDPRWRHAVVAPSDMPGAAWRLRTETPLDAYRYVGALDREQFDAGDRLRTLWERAGRRPRVTGDIEGLDRGQPEMTDAQAEAWSRYVDATRALKPVERSVVIAVCCHAVGAERWASVHEVVVHLGLVRLKAALELLVRHWGLRGGRRRGKKLRE